MKLPERILWILALPFIVAILMLYTAILDGQTLWNRLLGRPQRD